MVEEQIPTFWKITPKIVPPIGNSFWFTEDKTIVDRLNKDFYNIQGCVLLDINHG